jgi:two-component system, chemotaxis family, CheB/CheR fusion protein
MATRDVVVSAADRDPELEALLDYLKRNRGFDFTGYKRPSLTRRIQKRMQSIPVDSYAAYRAHLESNPDEFEDLFDTILINVTSFFRDEDAWDVLRAEVVPQLLAQKSPHEPIRVWSAACATGEEAYSLVIAFAEVMGLDEFRERVKVYATDVDESALVAARQAAYAAKDVETLAPEIVERYFERCESRYLFRRDLRRAVVFGRNDLIQDAPISRIDLLACRNALMYFDAATQGRIVSRFFFALNEGGYLLLGRAETLLTYTSMFAPVDVKRRIFRKTSRGYPGGRVMPQLRPAAVGGAGDRAVALDVRRAALRPDVTAQRQIRAGLEQSEHALRAAYAELESTYDELETTNEELQSTVEALETANEALHSANEELETMNEELQSTNAELQAMNDELRMRRDELSPSRRG